MSDQFFEDTLDYPLYVDSDYREMRRQRASSLHVLYFHKGQNPKNGKEQWQAKLRNGDVTTVYVPHNEGRQPTSDQEVWLCTDSDQIFKSSDSTFVVVSVCLLNKLFCDYVRLRFEIDETRLVDGKHPWNCYLPLDTQISALSVICTPDKFGKLQPTAEHQFWVCRFRKVAHLSPRGDFLIAVVELLREDVEAKNEHDKLVRLEADRRAAEAAAEAEEQRLRNEELKASMSEFDKRWAEREAERKQRRIASKTPGRGCVGHRR